ncbi:hypothetical protein DF186_26065, partial [Enterococcus hirae]
NQGVLGVIVFKAIKGNELSIGVRSDVVFLRQFKWFVNKFCNLFLFLIFKLNFCNKSIHRFNFGFEFFLVNKYFNVA